MVAEAGLEQINDAKTAAGNARMLGSSLYRSPSGSSRQFGEQSDEPAPRELRNDDFALRVDSVSLRRVLGKIEGNPVTVAKSG
jgi:hypothetical protein